MRLFGRIPLTYRRLNVHDSMQCPQERDNYVVRYTIGMCSSSSSGGGHDVRYIYCVVVNQIVGDFNSSISITSMYGFEYYGQRGLWSYHDKMWFKCFHEFQKNLYLPAVRLLCRSCVVKFWNKSRIYSWLIIKRWICIFVSGVVPWMGMLFLLVTVFHRVSSVFATSIMVTPLTR